MIVRIGVTTKNRPEYLPRCLSSCISQTYEPKELIILDTSRNPANFFDGIKDERVYYVHTKKVRVAKG